jgi:hypothetical protein
MKKLYVAAAAALSVVAVAVPAAVMSGASASASSAGAQFTADRTAMAAASGTFTQAFGAWERSGASYTQTSPFVNAYVTAIAAQDHKLLSQTWPAGVISDIDMVVRSDAAVQGTIQSLSGSSSDPDFFLSYDQDAAVSIADSNIVRHDLGIPLAAPA